MQAEYRNEEVIKGQMGKTLLPLHNSGSGQIQIRNLNSEAECPEQSALNEVKFKKVRDRFRRSISLRVHLCSPTRDIREGLRGRKYNISSRSLLFGPLPIAFPIDHGNPNPILINVR